MVSKNDVYMSEDGRFKIVSVDSNIVQVKFLDGNYTSKMEKSDLDSYRRI